MEKNKKELYDEDFSGLNLQESEKLKIEFNNCNFVNCRIYKVKFKHCKFVDCAFTNCDMSMSQFPLSTFLNTKFEKCKLSGINWIDIDPTWFDISLTECVLNYSSFHSMELKGMKIHKCTALETDFMEANLSGANLTETDFNGSLFMRTNLAGADFTEAFNYSIDPRSNNIKKAKFTIPEVIGLLDAFEIELG